MVCVAVAPFQYLQGDDTSWTSRPSNTGGQIEEALALDDSLGFIPATGIESPSAVLDGVIPGSRISPLQQLGASTAAATAAALSLATLTHADRRSLGRPGLGIPLHAAFVFAFVSTGNVAACTIAHIAYDTVARLTTAPTDRPA